MTATGSKVGRIPALDFTKGALVLIMGRNLVGKRNSYASRETVTR
jgi:hypothetical protein